MIPEQHPAAVWIPVYVAHVAAPPPKADNVTTIELNTRTKVCRVTVDDVVTTKQLTCRDQLTLAQFYRDKVGYRLEWLSSDVILLTKKGGKSAPTNLVRAA